jgi:hypothetical protein
MATMRSRIAPSTPSGLDDWVNMERGFWMEGVVGLSGSERVGTVGAGQ